jgi:hypothetical protein
MAPTAEQITEIMERCLKSHMEQVRRGETISEIAERSEILRQHTDDVKFQVVGHESSIACQHHGIQAMKQYFVTDLLPVLGGIDTTKPETWDVIRVIGGGDNPWVAIEFRNTGTSKKGEPFHYLNL